MSATTLSPEGLKAATQWIAGPDTGTSSKTIWSVLMGVDPDWPSRPSDPDDFGRCYRLLEAVPEWRPRLAEVAAAIPEWGPLVAIWPELEEMWRAVGYKRLHDGTWNKAASQRMDARMKAIDDDCMRAGGWEQTGPGSWRHPAGASKVTISPGLTMSSGSTKRSTKR